MDNVANLSCLVWKKSTLYAVNLSPLYYGRSTKACTFNKSELWSVDLVINRFLMKLFTTKPVWFSLTKTKTETKK